MDFVAENKVHEELAMAEEETMDNNYLNSKAKLGEEKKEETVEEELQNFIFNMKSEMDELKKLVSKYRGTNNLQELELNIVLTNRSLNIGSKAKNVVLTSCHRDKEDGLATVSSKEASEETDGNNAQTNDTADYQAMQTSHLPTIPGININICLPKSDNMGQPSVINIKYCTEVKKLPIHINEPSKLTPTENLTLLYSLKDALDSQIKETTKHISGDDKKTPLHIVVADGKMDLSLLQKLIEDYKADINKQDSTGKTPLHYAQCFDEHIKVLLEAGADPMIITDDGRTALHLYCLNTKNQMDGEIIKLFLKYSPAEILTIQDKYKKTAYDYACEHINKDFLYLLKSLHVAVSQSTEMDQIQKIISDGADINKQDSKGKTPLHYAHCFDEHIKELLKAGADPTIQNNKGETALHLYCSNKSQRNREIVKLFLEKSSAEILTIQDKQHKTAYDYACETRKHNLLYLLARDEKAPEFLQNGNKINMDIFQAIDKNDGPSLEILLAGAGMGKTLSHKYTGLGQTALHFAVLFSSESNKHNVLNILLKEMHNAEHHEDVNGLNPLHYACRSPGSDVIQCLHGKWKDYINKGCSNGKSPLLYAIENDCPDTATSLLDQESVDVTHGDKNGENALHYLATYKVKKMAKLFNSILNRPSFNIEMLHQKNTNNRSVLEISRDKGRIKLLSQIGKKLFDSNEFTITHFLQNCQHEDLMQLQRMLDRKTANSSPGWKKLFNSLIEQNNKRKNIEPVMYSNFSVPPHVVIGLSDTCCFKLGTTLFDHMKQKLTNISVLRENAVKFNRNDIVMFLDKLPKEYVSFDQVRMCDELLTYLGDFSKPCGEKLWRSLCRNIDINTDIQDEIKSKTIERQRDVYSPTEELFKKIKEVAPNYSLLYLYTALKGKKVNRMDVAKEFLLAITNILSNQLDAKISGNH